MKKDYFWGILIILIGILFLGNNLEIWNVSIFFDGWWTLFILVPSINGLFNGEGIISSLLGISIGILLLLACNNIIEWSMVGEIFIPIVIILVGFSLIVKTKSKVKKEGDKTTYLGIFGGATEILERVSKRLECIAVFGGIDLDLTNAEIKEDISIECVCVFGGIDLKLPDNVNVKSSGVPIFGGIDNKRKIKNKKAPTVFINYICIFGGTDIL